MMTGRLMLGRTLLSWRWIAAVGLTLCSLGLLAKPSSGQVAPRGQPMIADGTLLSDRGTLLRGPRWSTDISGKIPTRAQVDLLRSRGFNALHVYAEAPVCGYEAGAYLPLIRTLHGYTRDAGLYLVITIGNAGPIPQCPDWVSHDDTPTHEVFDLQFATTFWTKYGKEFADDPDVIFEIWNEPYWDASLDTSQPTPVGTRQLQKTIYELLRGSATKPGVAPQNPILLFSYVDFEDAGAILQDVSWLKQATSIDWTRTAIAFHMYGDPLSQTRSTVEAVSLKVPIVQTEMWIDGCPPSACVQNADRTSMHEATRTSWLTFLDISHLDTTAEFNSNLRSPLNQAGVIWVADYGGWPASSNPPVGNRIRLHNVDFVQADRSVDFFNPPLIANSSTASLATELEVISAGGMDVWLKARVNGKYVVRGANNLLIANGNWPATFQWLDRADGKSALRLRSNNRFVSADRNIGSKLVADRDKGGLPWEGFAVTVLGPP